MTRKLKYRPRHDHILVEETPERSHYVCHPPGGGWVMFLNPSALHQFFEPVGERVEPDVFRENVEEFVDTIYKAGPTQKWEGRKIFNMLQELGLLGDHDLDLVRGPGRASSPDKEADSSHSSSED